MRRLILGAVLAVVASAGLYMAFSASLAAAWDSRPATFSERYAPILKQHG
jgi:hypothetical protein